MRGRVARRMRVREVFFRENRLAACSGSREATSAPLARAPDASSKIAGGTGLKHSRLAGPSAVPTRSAQAPAQHCCAQWKRRTRGCQSVSWAPHPRQLLVSLSKNTLARLGNRVKLDAHHKLTSVRSCSKAGPAKWARQRCEFRRVHWPCGYRRVEADSLRLREKRRFWDSLAARSRFVPRCATYEAPRRGAGSSFGM